MTREPFRTDRTPISGNPVKVSARIYGVMVTTTLGTFATLSTMYELFFRPDIFA